MGGLQSSCSATLRRKPTRSSLSGRRWKDLGRLDLLINNAAIRREAPIETLAFTDWREVMGVTLDGAFLMSRAAIPHLLASDRGAIINIGGLTAYTGAANRAHVISAKAGLDGFTKALANELGSRGVTVNLVSPGMIDTNRAHSSSGGDPAHHNTTRTLVGRRGTPEEVAAAVRYLAGSQCPLCYRSDAACKRWGVSALIRRHASRRVRNVKLPVDYVAGDPRRDQRNIKLEFSPSNGWHLTSQSLPLRLQSPRLRSLFCFASRSES